MGFIFQWLLDEFISMLFVVMELIYSVVASNIFENVYIQFILIILSSFAGISFFLGLVPAISKYVSEKNVSINELIKNIFTGALFALLFTPFSTAIYQVGYFLSSEILTIASKASSIITNENIFDGASLVTIINGYTGWGIILKSALVLVMVVLLIIILWQQYIRAVDLLIYQLQGVISVFSMVGGDNSAFKTYLNGVLALTITQAVQVIFLYGGLTIVRQAGIFDMFMALAFFVAGVGLPKKMKEWSYTTGTAKGMSALAQTSMQTYTTIRMASMMH
ncbi:DUF6045 family protein [Erysipelothrix rhusiopathiae]|nr:DUF6045 family protein [Erysipelothrix rhusiopathiae]MDE8180963.1 DUF6045 family protein [Erysipelothrix rhusiopathiae]